MLAVCRCGFDGDVWTSEIKIPSSFDSGEGSFDVITAERSVCEGEAATSDVLSALTEIVKVAAEAFLLPLGWSAKAYG